MIVNGKWKVILMRFPWKKGKGTHFYIKIKYKK